MNNSSIYNYVLVADIGGSHITAALCDMDSEALIDGTRARVEFSSKGTAQNIIDSWLTAFKQVIAKSEGLPLRMGIAMPGPFDYQEGISYIRGLNKYESLYEVNIKNILSAELGIAPDDIRFRNDAEAAIAGEAFAGAAADCRSAVGITLGTGFGTAHYYNSQTLDLNWGSTPLFDSIADDYLSTRWFLKRYFQLTGLSVLGVKELAAIAEQSPAARRVFTEFAENLRDFLATQLKGYDIEMLLICGNIAKSHRYFVPVLKKQFRNIRMELGQLGEDSALLGAAALFKNNVSLANTY